jgi:hypothetical protein
MCLIAINTLAYFGTEFIEAVIGSMIQGPGFKFGKVKKREKNRRLPFPDSLEPDESHLVLDVDVANSSFELLQTLL